MPLLSKKKLSLSLQWPVDFGDYRDPNIGLWTGLPKTAVHYAVSEQSH